LKASHKKGLTLAPGYRYFDVVRHLKYISGGLVIFLGLLVSGPQPSIAISKYAGEFLGLGVGARAMGMGGAYVAISDDASAIYWNPSGMAGISRHQLMLMHAESFGGLVIQDYVALTWPLRADGGALGVGLMRLGVDDIPYTEWDPETQRPRLVKEVSDAEYALFFSYARRASERWRLGGSAKLIYKKVGDDAAFGLGADAGLQYHLRPWLHLGARLSDLTSTPVAWNSGQKDYVLPMLTLGAAGRLAIPSLRGAFRLAVDVETRFEGRQFAAWASAGGISIDPRAGLEYWYRDRLAVRAGLQPGRFSAGASLRIGGWGVDYAFLGHEELDNSHRLSALVAF
jgi:hypothetical protein